MSAPGRGSLLARALQPIARTESSGSNPQGVIELRPIALLSALSFSGPIEQTVTMALFPARSEQAPAFPAPRSRALIHTYKRDRGFRHPLSARVAGVAGL